MGSLCLKNTEECPINDFVSSSVQRTDLEQKGYKKLKISNDIFFYYTNTNEDGNLLVDVDGAQDHMCIYWEEKYSISSKYTLMYGNYKQYCSSLPDTVVSTDTRYTSLFEYSKYQIYDDNNLANKLLNLPGFTSYFLDGKYSLFSRSYINWSNTCLMEGSSSEVETWVDLHVKTKSMRSYFWGILFFFIILATVNIFGFAIIAKSPLLRYQTVIVGKLILLINYLAFIIINNSKNIQDELKVFFEKFNEDICSDEITNLVLHENFRLFNKVEGMQNFVFFAWKYFLYLIMFISFVVFLPLIYQMLLLKVKVISI